MSGNSHIVTCPKCKHEKPLRGKAMTLAFTCPKCGIYIRMGKWNQDLTKFNITANPVLAIGAKGKIDEDLYEVMGFVQKQETKYRYSWREYLLFNPFRGYAFLSEYDGHWNFIWPVEENRSSSDADFYDGYDHFQLYQRYNARVTYATGEFFFDVVDITESTYNKEFIAPPYLFTLEQSDDSLLWCKGEYMTRQEVATAFNVPIAKLPAKKGMGYTQPVSTAFRRESLVKISLLIAFVLIVAQLFFSYTAAEKEVFRQNFYQQDLKDQKFFVTPSFTLDDGSKNLEIHIYAPLQNDWFFAEFALIDEGTGTEYNFTKDIEYYAGYEDGESWSEGSTQGDAVLSQVPSGKYHINVYPEFSSSSHEFTMVVRRDVSTLSNFLFTFGALILFPAGFFIWNSIQEERRWSDSDYSHH